MTTVSDAAGASGLSAQYQAAAAKTALDAQKQEGAAAIALIESAAAVTQAAVSSGPRATGNNIDVTV